MTQRDMAGYLEVDVKTLRNWRKNKSKLYNMVLKGFAFNEAVNQSEKNYKKLLELSKNISS